MLHAKIINSLMHIDKLLKNKRIISIGYLLKNMGYQKDIMCLILNYHIYIKESVTRRFCMNSLKKHTMIPLGEFLYTWSNIQIKARLQLKRKRTWTQGGLL